ncbi:unnamed protein product [Adineta steineri]|uniref:Uncharacterized protein n=1 Tax=Adineta steineri TaxID=433720 RepID=A0A815SIL4_9BILA|nr:unnamed protein product [Adineta steineri]CAF1490607.1 unnamed protein product [Adineta steineri]CAF1641379.1 unnamed protein product [Adineta steineri]CAF1641393.1 unnamed protein product [Adineta steineri]
MIIPISNNDKQLDIYVYCTLHNNAKYDFTVPQPSESYTAYILENYIDKNNSGYEFRKKDFSLRNASANLLLILKKYMLYYSHQWEKTAKDYYQLLAVATPLTDQDKILCDLFIRYNEKIHRPR